MSASELLVLGGAGFLGAQVVRAASLHGAVTSATRGKGAREPAGVTHLPWEAHDASTLERALERPGLSGVILCAALARGTECESRPHEARELNVELPARVAEHCARRELPCVHVSTDLVFGAAQPPPGGFREHDSPEPQGVYSETKRAGELAVLAAHPGAVVARLPLLFGDSCGRGVGASDGLLCALKAGQRVGLFVDEFRTPLDVVEAAAALVELALGEFSGIWHLAGPVRLSRHELGALVLEAAGWDESEGLPRATRSAELELSPPRPADASLDSTRARSSLASPLSTPREALQARPPRG